MLAGPLRFRIVLQFAVDGQGALGGVSTGYTDGPEVWAAIEPLTPREFLQAQAIQSDIQVKIRIRYREGLNAKMRIKHVHGRGSPKIFDFYDVVGPPIEVDSNRTEVWLMCKKRDSEGFRQGTPS